MSSTDSRLPAFARLFVGLWPDPEVREALVAQRDAWCWPPGTGLTPPERLHLTLHFLGIVPRERVSVLVQRLDVGFAPFELRLTQAEAWSGGLVVLRTHATPPAMQSLHGRLSAVLRSLRQPVAREDLVPHVTLARHAAGAVPPVLAAPVRWPVEGYVLVESGLPPPRRYRIVAEYA